MTHKIPWTVETYYFFGYMRFFIVPCASTHLNVLYVKSWLTILLYERSNMFQTFLVANFLSGSACTLI